MSDWITVIMNKRVHNGTDDVCVTKVWHAIRFFGK